MIIDRFSGAYSFLSNFAPVTLSIEGITYHSVEAAFQAAKTDDETSKLRIAKATTPGAAKRLGRQVTLRRDWEDIKIGVMGDLIAVKFDTQPVYAAGLAETGDALLIEGNTWHDNFWGTCFCRSCEDRQGLNHLGSILMQTRDAARV